MLRVSLLWLLGKSVGLTTENGRGNFVGKKMRGTKPTIALTAYGSLLYTSQSVENFFEPGPKLFQAMDRS